MIFIIPAGPNDSNFYLSVILLAESYASSFRSHSSSFIVTCQHNGLPFMRSAAYYVNADTREGTREPYGQLLAAMPLPQTAGDG